MIKKITLRKCIKCGKYQVLLPERIFGANYWKDTKIEDCRQYRKGILCRIGIHKMSERFLDQFSYILPSNKYFKYFS